MISYEKIALISEKNYNKVWLANIKNSDTLVIVKEISHANIDVLNTIASIKNVHIPNILSCETTDSITTIVEEYISGLPLNSYIKEKQLSETEIIGLISQVCDGIRTLHYQDPPIIHKDLKPSNILVSSEGIVKIIDFDAARKYKENADTDTCHLGTAAFASPEHYGYSQTDARSDIYSLGAVMYELFSGKQFPKISAERAFDTNELYNSEYKLSKKLVHIIKKCTMFNPSARYQNIDDLQHELKNYNNCSKKLYTACAIAALMIFCFISSFTILGNQKNKVKGAQQPAPNTTIPEVTSNIVPYQSEVPASTTNTAITASVPPAKVNKKTAKPVKNTAPKIKKKKNSNASKNIKNTKNTVNKKKISNDEKNDNTKKIKTDKTSVKNKKKVNNKKADKNKDTPAPKKTASPEFSSPVNVDYTGKTNYYLDSYNSETGSSIMFIIFYLKNNPALTPLNVGSDILEKSKLQKVYIKDMTNENTYVIPEKYWSLVHNHIVKISDKFLSALQLNNTYNIILECDNTFITVKTKIIDDLNMVTAPFNNLGIVPGCFEYSQKTPAAQTFALTNGYGRKITKIIIADSGQTLNTKYYSIDPTNTYITFKKSFFKEVCNGSDITLNLYHNKVAQIQNDSEYLNFTFSAEK